MLELKGDIWQIGQPGDWVAITTNGVVKANGQLVMGKGIALEAAQRYPRLAKEWGLLVKQFGNEPFVFIEGRLVSFPTKDDWRKPSTLALIEASCKVLGGKGFQTLLQGARVLLPRPGCGNGQLAWIDVSFVLKQYLGDQFVAISRA